MTLYEIDTAIAECIDPETGEVDAERIEALMMQRDTKIDNIVEYIFKLNADIEAAKKRIEAIQAIKKANETTVERLKAYLQNALDGQKRKTATYSVSYRKSKSVAVDSEEAIPLEYWKASYTVNKTAIKDAISSGVYVPGAHLQDNVSVIIK